MYIQVVRWKQEEGRMTENGKPKYFTLMEELKEKIISGRIQPGEKLPSECSEETVSCLKHLKENPGESAR